MKNNYPQIDNNSCSSAGNHVLNIAISYQLSLFLYSAYSESTKISLIMFSFKHNQQKNKDLNNMVNVPSVMKLIPDIIGAEHATPPISERILPNGRLAIDNFIQNTQIHTSNKLK